MQSENIAVKRMGVRIYVPSIKDFMTINVQVEVDMVDLAKQYAGRAYGNKSQVAKMARGAVVVRIK